MLAAAEVAEPADIIIQIIVKKKIAQVKFLDTLQAAAAADAGHLARH